MTRALAKKVPARRAATLAKKAAAIRELAKRHLIKSTGEHIRRVPSRRVARTQASVLMVKA